MIKLQLIIYFSCILFSALANENKNQFKVITRDQKGNLIEEIKLFDTLLNPPYAETKYFKVVEGRNQDPVSLDNPILGIKAATALYHSEIAHAYFEFHLGHKHLQKKTIIRIEMKDSFSSDFHWCHEKYSNNFNNAGTIPPSDHTKAGHIEPWGNEIWFRPAKIDSRSSILERIGNVLDKRGYKNSVETGYLEKTAVNISSSLINGTSDYMHYELGYLLGMLTFVEVLPKSLILLGKTHKQHVMLDSAMIPEIIYHEFSHVALYDYLSFDKKTPIVEGIANYFAAKIMGSFILGAKAGKFSKGNGSYTGKSNIKYEYTNELTDHSHSSFLLSVFYQLDKEFPDFEHILFDARKNLNKESNIKYDLVDSLHKEVNAYYPDDKVKIQKLKNVLSKFYL